MEILEELINLIFPKFCYSCGGFGKYICSNCIKSKMYFNPVQICHVCGRECSNGLVHSECKDLSFVDGVLFITLYQTFIRKIIREIKYYFCSDIINEIAKVMSDYLLFYKFIPGNVLITYVPMHGIKERSRGFNQAKLLAQKISHNTDCELFTLLRRKKYSHAQVGLGKFAREMNLKDIFEISSKVDVEGKNILIIDDVFTTGSTLNECAKVLKNAGAQKVFGFVFARARL